MKQIIIAFLLCFGLITSLKAQLQIDSVFIDNDTLLPDPNFQQQISTDTVFLEGLSFDFRGVSNMPVGIDSVFWRVSIDYDQDGDFDDNEMPYGNSILYNSGKVAVGSSPQEIIEALGLLYIPFGEVLQMKVELTDDDSDFDSATPSGNYNSFIFQIMDTTGGRVTMGSKKKGNPSRSNCIGFTGVVKNNVFQFYVFNWLDNISSIADTCLATSFELTSAIVNQRNLATGCSIDLTPTGNNGNVSITRYDVSGNIITPYSYSTDGAFILKSGEKAKVEITIPSTGCPASLQIGQIDIQATFGGCINSTRSQSFCFDCDDPVIYDDHSTNPSATAANNELEIPKLTYASDSIGLNGNVKILTGGNVELVVNNSGVIHVSGGEVFVESGAYFWAHKMDVCPILPTSPITPPTSIEGKSWQLKKVDEVKIVPNPFTTSLFVDLELEEVSQVTVTLFDVLGHQKRKILDENILEIGQQRVEILTDDLNAGLYYCQIEINDKIITKSLVKVE